MCPFKMYFIQGTREMICSLCNFRLQRALLIRLPFGSIYPCKVIVSVCGDKPGPVNDFNYYVNTCWGGTSCSLSNEGWLASTLGCRDSEIWIGVGFCYLEWAVITLGMSLNLSDPQFLFLICKMMTTQARSLWRLESNCHFIAKGLKKLYFWAHPPLCLASVSERPGNNMFTNLFKEVGGSDIWATTLHLTARSRGPRGPMVEISHV